MRFLRTNTAVIITVGPFYDKTDGVTIETALTITNERITLTADTDDGAAPTNILDNIAGATSGTANDLNYITGNDAGMMQLELAAANVNRLGRMFLSITDAANHVPVFHEFIVLPAVIYDALVLGTDLIQSDLTQILGVGQSATDLKDFADDGYDPSTNKVQGVVLTDTVTTYTGNTPQTGNVFAALPANFVDLSISAATGLVNITQGAADKVWGTASRTLSAFSTALALSVWDVLAAAIATANSIGVQLKTNADVASSTLATQASVTTIDDLLDTEMPALTTAVGAVKTQTDKLTFNAANMLQVDVQEINDVEVLGAGTAGNLWRGV